MVSSVLATALLPLLLLLLLCATTADVAMPPPPLLLQYVLLATCQPTSLVGTNAVNVDSRLCTMGIMY